MKTINENLKFELLTRSVSEISNIGEWNDPTAISIDEKEIAEMIKDDADPFYVEFVGLYEGMSNNNRMYTKEAVATCVDAMVGVNMYKGHEEPGSTSWKYREPVGRIVAAKTKTIEIEGKKVLAAVGKAYISDSDKKLRNDIRKRMAGSVSILGDAKMTRNQNETTRTVIALKKPLKSIDFCNPGMSGLQHAEVTAIVSEMVGTIEVNEEKIEETMTKKLTKEELLVEYKPEIMSLVGEQATQQIQEIAQSKRDLAIEQEKFKDEKAVLEGQISEMKRTSETAKSEAIDWKKKFEAERDARLLNDLKLFAVEHVAEMKKTNEPKFVDMAMKRTQMNVVEGDLEKSKSAFKTSIESAFAELQTISEMIGGDSEEPKKRLHAGNKSGEKENKKMNRFLSKELAESASKRNGS